MKQKTYKSSLCQKLDLPRQVSICMVTFLGSLIAGYLADYTISLYGLVLGL
jgi:hypothetical protein